MSPMVVEARGRLLARRRAIWSSYDATQRDAALGARGQPPAAELVERLGDREQDELGEIDAALARIAAGRYGRCESCQGPIGRQRLIALPQAALCLDCSDTRERERLEAARAEP